jgi:diguanylate cyclase (GGDEF)-like protein
VGFAIDLVQHDRPEDALTALNTAHAREQSERLRDQLDAHFDREAKAEAAHDRKVALWLTILRAATLSGIITSVVTMIMASRRTGNAIAAGWVASRNIEQLFAMGDMLQSAADMDDTNAVLRASAARLMPEVSGSLYVFNNSRDRLDLATHWGSLPAAHTDHMAPSACWALKRGKPHMNKIQAGALRCAHCSDGSLTLDIPMTARGQLHGLLEIMADGPDAAGRLEAVRPIATAIGDAMSLALSNAVLRDQLRHQALRDALTGLYNRRFLEEMLERLCLEAVRRDNSIAMIMLDLDHFKKLNDAHGHGAGDTVLRDVAAAILASIRATDIACRYGGEELLVLLPDCGLEMAAAKAEQIRVRIASLGFVGGIAVTASFGVATLPETSSTGQALLSTADAALYEAKTGGRDRVVLAAPRRIQRAPATIVVNDLQVPFKVA